jgi:hypothetical protein
VPKKIDDSLAYAHSSFALSWALLTTLIREGLLTKEDVLTSFDLAKKTSDAALAPPMEDLRSLIEKSRDSSEGN